MECGFDTIGNATVICYDGEPVIATDPWIEGDAYFGSWCLSHEIPEEQKTAILKAKYIWFSHGHPDHLNPHCIELFRNHHILLPDHYGKKIYNDLKSSGFKVEILRNRQWKSLSPRIRFMCTADMNQDAMSFISVNQRLVINANDAPDLGRDYLSRKLTRQFKYSLLLSISGYPGESDFCNFFDENDKFIAPKSDEYFVSIGKNIARKADRFGAKYYIPTSSFHRFQREDSQWILPYSSNLNQLSEGFDSKTSTLLSPFMRYDCLKDEGTRLNPRANAIKVLPPSQFGDDWNAPFEKGDEELLKNYFGKFNHLKKVVDFIRFEVGSKSIELAIGQKTGRGLSIQTPRKSLLESVKYEIFDDLLIGNFIRAKLIGSWPDSKFYPDFIPYITKYGDNGRAYSEAELQAYFNHYRAETNFGWWSVVENTLSPYLVRKIPNHSLLRNLARKVYAVLKHKAGASA